MSLTYFDAFMFFLCFDVRFVVFGNHSRLVSFVVLFNCSYLFVELNISKSKIRV